MVDYAQQYVERGWYIFPAWWVNDDGSCGCGDRNCKDIGKHPIGDCVHRGVWDASNDFKRVTTWWKHHRKANIGLHPGPSGLIAIDLDKYKDEYDATATGELITKADEETLTSLTGGGGNHLGFKLPDGERFGSHSGGLPKGIDVRCWGGYIILPPSNHKSGNRYQWEMGYGPDEMTPAPLPQKLYDILKAAQQKAQAAKVAIKANLPQPDVKQWHLPPWLIDDLNNGQYASDRSTNDFRVMCALGERGLSDDDITAVWQHHPIGIDGKYGEDGDRYLSITLGKVRAKVGYPVGQYNGYQNGVKVGNAGGVDDMAAQNGYGPAPTITPNGAAPVNGHSSATAQQSAKLVMSPGRRIKHTKDGVTRIVRIVALNTVLTVDDGPNVYDAEYADDGGAWWPIIVSDNDDIALMTADVPAPKTSAWHEIAKEIARITDAYETPEDRQTHIVEELSAYIAACERSKHTLLIAALQNANAGFTKTSASKFIDNCVRDAKKAAKEKPQKSETQAAADAGINTWPYGVEGDCIVEYWTDDDGDVKHSKLCNFNAWIVADVSVDDGEGITRKIVIGGKLGSGVPLPEVEIKADEFESMQWVVASWGARANIAPGKGSKDTLRHAIQTLSADNMQQRNSRAHTGWAVIEGKRVFVHNDGAVGGEGIKVSLPQQLHGYRLPTDSAVDPVTAMQESIKLMDVADAKISAPLWASMYLAPLSEFIAPVFTISVEGGSGSYKSSYSAVMLNHYGPKFEENKSMPADWLGTANSLEKLCHHAKDVPLIIDDLRPTSSPSEHKELMAKVNHIVRAVGNRQGRSRLDSNSEFKRTYAPRGVVIMTAERKAMGKSTNSRILTLDVEPGDIDGPKLAVAQRQRHIYGYAMAGFIQWVADNWGDLEADLPNAVIDIRTKHSVDGQHKRLPNATAVLYVAFEAAMTYAVEIGAITEEDAASRLSALETALSGIAETQNEATEEEDPALKYITIIATLIAQEKAYLQPKGDKANGKNLGSSFAERLGWYDSHNVYLLPGAYNAVCKYASAEGWIFPSDEPTLRKELNRAGFITKTDVGKLTSLQRAPGDTRTRVPVLAISYAKFGEVLKAMGVDVP